MNIQASRLKDTLYVHLDGELDEHAVAKLRQMTDKLIDEHAGASRAVFDLSGVRFMDSTGIGFLIGRYKKLKRYDMEMMLENPDMQADKVLSLSGIYSLIPKI